MTETMSKIDDAVKFREEHGLQFHIEVDGGIASDTVATAVSHGASVLVAGTSLFKAPDMAAAIQQFRDTRR